MFKFINDKQFYLALLLGPLALAGLSFFVMVRSEPVSVRFDLMRWGMFILIYPVLEEIVFRGLLQEWLNNCFKSKKWSVVSAANLLTSALFVAAHFINQPWHWALLVFFPSIVFGYMKERHNSLLPPIILHVSYNLGFILVFG